MISFCDETLLQNKFEINKNDMKAVFDFIKRVVDKNITFCFFISFFIIKIPLMAQETALDEVVVSSPRIELPAEIN